MMFALLLLSGTIFCGCGSGSSNSGTTQPPPQTTTATPTITTAAAQNGAVIVTLADTTSGSQIYYTLDGSTPGTSSQVYEAPFLVASNLTVKAFATATGDADSKVASQTFSPNIGSGTLVWSDEFTGSAGVKGEPNASTWTYDTGTNCCGNDELETYCAWGSTTAPCDTNHPNAYVGEDGYLHIVAQNPSSKVYTSARLKSQGLFSFMYGRIEARIKVPESQGMWPAFWLLGNNIATVNWPTCGETDIMEHIDGSNPPPAAGEPPYGSDWIAGSLHGVDYNTGTKWSPQGFSAADWHIYGAIWSKGQIQFYVDDVSNVYATYTPGSVIGGIWAFDQGPQFILLNLAVGGNWPGSPDATTVFPGEMMVDYVRIYTN